VRDQLRDEHDVQHPAVPAERDGVRGHALRRRVVDAASLAMAWSPRIQGAPSANDDAAWTPGPPLVASVTAYLDPLGQHDWSVGDPCQKWDGTTYMDNLLAHFFATNGQDLYYLSHPVTHTCLANTSCPFLQ
jgi:hypothetical protein